MEFNNVTVIGDPKREYMQRDSRGKKANNHRRAQKQTCVPMKTSHLVKEALAGSREGVGHPQGRAGGYCSALRGVELSGHGYACRKLKSMVPGERSQSGKATPCMIPTIGHSGKEMIKD